MKRILVVDDEFDIAESLRIVLEEEGYAAEACFSVPESREAVDRELPDLIVADVMMPMVTGLDWLRELRSSTRTRHIPVILMSAVRPKVPAAEAGFQVFLLKPFGLEVFLDRVAELVGDDGVGEPKGPAGASS